MSVQHLSELVNDVLDMSKIESGYLELQNDTFDLNTLIGSGRSCGQCTGRGNGNQL